MSFTAKNNAGVILSLLSLGSYSYKESNSLVYFLVMSFILSLYSAVSNVLDMFFSFISSEATFL